MAERRPTRRPASRSATANALVERLRAAVESTGAIGFGAFAGLHPLDDRRLLAASTDSVGTKLIVARERGALRNCGADLAAHCINDVITSGADPLLLLDYVAANRIDLEQVAELVDGAAEVCRAAGCALIGGETAELPGVYRDDELDFAGTCVGVVERERLVDGSRVAGRRRDRRLPVGRRARERLHARPADPRARTTTTATTSSRRRASTSTTCAGCAASAHAFAHVTGGGIAGNLERVVPDGLRATIDWDAWERPPVFDWLARHVDEEELRRVFNLGIGFCAVVARPGRATSVIGRIERGRDRRPRLGRGNEPAGADRRGAAGRRGRVEPAGRARRSSARERASIATATFALDCLRDARGARPRAWRLARGARRRARRARRLHAPADARRSSSASRTGSSTCTPSLLPRSPARTRSTTRSRPASTTTGVDRALRRRGPRQRARSSVQERRRRSTPRETLVERIHAVEHRLLPEVVRPHRAGDKCQRDEGSGRCAR